MAATALANMFRRPAAPTPTPSPSPTEAVYDALVNCWRPIVQAHEAMLVWNSPGDDAIFEMEMNRQEKAIYKIGLEMLHNNLGPPSERENRAGLLSIVADNCTYYEFQAMLVCGTWPRVQRRR